MTPSREDFEAYARVSAFMRQSAHQLELAAGRYTLHFRWEGATVSTEHGEEPMTDELWTQLGYVRTEEGWSHDGTR